MTLAKDCDTVGMQSNVKAVLGGEKMRIDRVAFATALAKKDINCKRLAEMSGVSRVTITAVKSGKSCSKETAEKLAAVLGREIIKEE